ncbi:MAG: 3-oxoacyl-[acyl-carrier-protein] synthase III C-terminal domain-containing protein [Pseudomonadota bacterium]
MQDIFLSDLAYALGDDAVTVHESAKAGRLVSDPDALLNAGFRTHHLCRPQTTVVDLAARSLDRFQAPLCAAPILIFATALTPNGNLGDPVTCEETGDVRHLMDFPASRLQVQLGLADTAVIGLNQQACTATLGAIRVARGLLAAEPDLGQVICVSADRFPEGATYEQSYNVISDGSAAFRISKCEGPFRVLACHQLTNGTLAAASDDETVGAYFSHTQRLIGETVARAGLGIADVDWLVPQNMNRAAWLVMARLLQLPEERVACATLGDVGHVIAADNIINLHSLAASGQLKQGERVLMVMAGFGMNWQAVLLEVTS